jgi:hypothetical protein
MRLRSWPSGDVGVLDVVARLDTVLVSVLNIALDGELVLRVGNVGNSGTHALAKGLAGVALTALRLRGVQVAYVLYSGSVERALIAGPVLVRLQHGAILLVHVVCVTGLGRESQGRRMHDGLFVLRVEGDLVICVYLRT